MNKILGIGLALVLVVILAGGTYAFKNSQSGKDNKTITTIEEAEGSATVEDENIKADINVEAKVTQTVDCGSEDCFEEKFSKCEPSTLKGDIGIAAASYKILEPSNGGCKMTFEFTSNPNPEWQDKEMTCVFDNKLSFQAAAEKLFNAVVNGAVTCDGPLYNIMRQPPSL